MGWVWDCSFSADSQFLFTGNSFNYINLLINYFNYFLTFKNLASSDGIARLWNVATGEIGREYTGHQRVITSLAFSDQLVD